MDYFVKYETATKVNSFLVNDKSSTEDAWDEAVAHIEEIESDTAAITVFLKV